MIISALEKILQRLTFASHYVIAYSGGLDSTVLLHAMSVLRSKNPAITLQTIHVNHQLNPKANAWALHCEKTANTLHIPIVIESVTIDLQPGDSLEENARNVRYAILKKYVNDNAVLLTAHTMNDQAETFLLQALRGAGSKGLSAMPEKKRIGHGIQIRPLLHFSRQDLEKYAHDQALQWIEDDSNIDTRFNRNYLRHDVFPVLQARFPAVMQNFARSSRLIAEQESVIADIAAADYAFCRLSADRLSRSNVASLSPARQRLVLREWFADNQLRMPNEKHVRQIQKDVFNAAPDAHPIFKLENTVISRDREALIIQRT
jgi:tRNA(Ile)-lysidine synthase